jgi:hypothetical protein
MRKIALALAPALLLAASVVPAFADTQPSQVSNAADRNGGASAPGPHCHINLVSSEHNAAFDQIITGAIHQAHVETGLPTGIFQAVPCPE